MAHASIPQSSNVIGRFTEKDEGNFFEYGVNTTGWCEDLYPHVVYVGYLGETRIARVLKTRAFIVIDEDAGGCPVEQMWNIKNLKEF
jgi:hypothetical protein